MEGRIIPNQAIYIKSSYPINHEIHIDRHNITMYNQGVNYIPVVPTLAIKLFLNASDITVKLCSIYC